MGGQAASIASTFSFVGQGVRVGSDNFGLARRAAAAIQVAALGHDAGALLGLLGELVAAKASLGWSSEYCGGDGKPEQAFWAAFGIKKSELMKRVAAEKKVKA